MKTPRTVAVIGGINRDDVVTPTGRRRKGVGGILFNVSALRRFAPRTTIIQPIAYLGNDIRQPVRRWLQSLNHIDDSGIIDLPESGNHCKLRYTNTSDRTETLRNVVPALTYRQLRPALSADLALVNFISGRDIQLSALENFRNRFAGTIYLDIHSYLLGRRRDGTRFPRRPAHCARVCAVSDILQMNRSEFRILSGCEPNRTAVAAWLHKLLRSMRCKCVLITLGRDGVLCCQRISNRWRVLHVPVRSVTRPADPTGAGDTFAGAWIAEWLRGRSMADASRVAARRAASPIIPGA